MKRLPLVLACGLVIMKLPVIIVARVSPEHMPPLFETIARRDAPSMWAAGATTRLVFDQSHMKLGPTDPEALFFDAALLLFTAVEWYICGVAIVWLLRRGRRGRTPAAAT